MVIPDRARLGSFFRASWSVEIFITMERTEYSRKLDSTGRLVIPNKLREQMHLVPGQEYFFFIHEEGDRSFICIECPQANEMKLSMAKVEEYLKSRGLKITPEN